MHLKHLSWLRQIITPTGKVLDVTYHSLKAVEGACIKALSNEEKYSNLCVCIECGADKAQPLYWDEASATTWWLQLYCTACGVCYEVHDIPQAIANRYDVELDRRNEMREQMARTKEREAMATWADRFADALEKDAIMATDF